MNLSQIQDYGRGLLIGDLTTPTTGECTKLLTPEEVATLPKTHHWTDWTYAEGLSHSLARKILNHHHHDRLQQCRAAAFLLCFGIPYELGLAQLWCEAHETDVQRFLFPAQTQTRAA